MALEPASDYEISPTASDQTTDHQLELIRIEVYVGITAIFLTFLVVFGSFRRRSYERPLRFSIWTAYFALTYLITYTLGQMQSAQFSNELFAVWAVFLVFVLGNADSMSAYSLEENENISNFVWQVFFQSFWMGYLIGQYITETKLKVPLFILWGLAVLKTAERTEALAWASKSGGSVKNSKLIADYMIDKHSSDEADEVDPTSMKGYKYLVAGELENKALDIGENKVITVHKIWVSKGTLLSSTNDPKNSLKDICLSYALYRLLRRRFAGFPIAESCQDKTWKFVRDGLLHEVDYKRAFRVIETELAFLHDSFYTVSCHF